MISFQHKIDVRDLVRGLDLASKQVRYAASVAINRSAYQARIQVQREMTTAFKNPTPYTIKSVLYKKATKADLTSLLYISGDTYSKNPYSPAEQLGHEFSGGGRNVKRFEKRLQAAGYMRSGEFIVPGRAAKLDGYGNMSKGQIQQILSQLKATGDPATYASGSRRSKAKRRGKRIFWSDGKGRLPKGAWQSTGDGPPGALLIVIGAPRYRRRMFLDRITDDVVRREFAPEFKRAYEQAMATAR